MGDSVGEMWRTKIFVATCGCMMRALPAIVSVTYVGLASCSMEFAYATCVYSHVHASGAFSLPCERYTSCVRPRLVLPDRIFCCPSVKLFRRSIDNSAEVE